MVDVRKTIGQIDPLQLAHAIIVAKSLTQRGLERGLFYLANLDENCSMLMGPIDDLFMISFDDRDEIVCDTASDAVDKWFSQVRTV